MNNIFRALADPTRRTILELLSKKDLNAGEIADFFNISKPSISHHLTTLKNAQLISDKRQGQNIIYTLNHSVFNEVIEWFFSLNKQLESKNE